MSLQSTPIRLNLKKDEKLEIEWQDGLKSVYPLDLLRSMCPCALCRQVREEDKGPKTRSKLNLLPGNYSQPTSNSPLAFPFLQRFTLTRLLTRISLVTR